MNHPETIVDPVSVQPEGPRGLARLFVLIWNGTIGLLEGFILGLARRRARNIERKKKISEYAKCPGCGYQGSGRRGPSVNMQFTRTQTGEERAYVKLTCLRCGAEFGMPCVKTTALWVEKNIFEVPTE